MGHATKKFAWLLVALALAAVVIAQDGTPGDDGVIRTNCTRVHPRVGLLARMVGADRNVGGTVVIEDDCTFSVRGFTYDGTGPDAVLVGAASVDDLGEGITFRTLPDGTVWNGSEVILEQLDGDVTWNDINIISVWSRQLSTDFGSADLDLGIIRLTDDDDGDVDDDGILDVDDEDFIDDFDDDDGDVDDDGILDAVDQDFIDFLDDDDDDFDDDGDPDDDDGDEDDDGVLDTIIDDDGDPNDDDGDEDDDGVLDVQQNIGVRDDDDDGDDR